VAGPPRSRLATCVTDFLETAVVDVETRSGTVEGLPGSAPRCARIGFVLLALAPLACAPGLFAHDDALKRPLVATAAWLILAGWGSARGLSSFFRGDPAAVPLTLAWLAGFVSSLACAVQGGNLPEMFWPLLLSAGGVAAYAGASRSPGDERFFRRSLPRWVVGAACVVAAYGLLQRAGVDPLLPDAARLNPDLEPGSTLGGKTFAGEYQALVFPLALALAATASTGRGRAASAGAVFLIGSHLIATGARGAWMGAGAGTVLLLALGLVKRVGPDRRRALPPAAVAAAVGVAMSALVLSQVTGAADWARRIRDAMAPPPGRDTGLVRRELWKSTVRMAADHPAFGVGPGQFPLRIQPYRSTLEMRESDPQRVGREAWMSHNDFLQRLAETGALGAAAVVLVLFALARKSAAHLRGQGDRESFLLTAGLLAGVSALAVASLLGNPFHQPAVGALASLAMGLAERVGNPAPPDWSVESAPRTRDSSLSPSSRWRLLPWLLLAPGLLGWPLAFVDAAHARLLASIREGPEPRAAGRADAADAGGVRPGAPAEEYLGGIGRVCPGGWDSLRALGLFHLDRAKSPGEIERAEAHLAAAKALHPNDPETWDAWGRAMRIQGRRDEGRRAFERAVALDPIVRAPRMNLALACEQDGLYGQAVGQYDALIRLDAKDAAAHFGRGHALARSARYAEAAEAFAAAERTGYRFRGRGARAEVLRMDSLKEFRDSEAGKAWLR
jgi:O-antigen ligase